MEESRFLRDIPPQLLGEEKASGRSAMLREGVEVTLPFIHAGPPQPRKARYRSGMRIRHARFGEGVILEDQVHGEDEVLTVEFETAGLKRLDADAAPIQVLD